MSDGAADPTGTRGEPGIVDAHQHVWDLAVRPQPWLERPGNEPLLRNYGAADLLPLARAAGVTATVVVQTVADEAETTELLALAAASDLIAGVVGWADLEAAGTGDAIAALRERPDGGLLSGIRHPVLAEDDPGWLRRPAVLAGLAAVGAAGLCYDLVLAADLLPAAIDAAEACPGLVFVLDHLGNPDLDGRPDELWMTDIRRLAALPNTVCKLSGVLGQPGPGRRPGGLRQRGRPPRALLRRGAQGFRARSDHVRLGLAGLHAVGVLRPGRRGGPRPDGRAQPDRAGGGVRRNGPPDLPARPVRFRSWRSRQVGGQAADEDVKAPLEPVVAAAPDDLVGDGDRVRELIRRQ